MRALHANLLADIALASAVKTELFELYFASGTLYITTASQDLLWNANVYEAVGGHLAHEGFGESSDAEDAGCRVEFSGVDQTIVALILAGGYRGRKAICYHAHFNPSTGLVVSNPIAMFDGHMNGAFLIDDDPGDYGDGTVKVSTRFTERISEVSRIRGVRTNVHSHQAAIPGASTDEFFKHVPSLSGMKIYWGVKNPNEPGTPTPTPPPVTKQPNLPGYPGMPVPNIPGTGWDVPGAPTPPTPPPPPPTTIPGTGWNIPGAPTAPTPGVGRPNIDPRGG